MSSGERREPPDTRRPAPDLPDARQDAPSRELDDVVTGRLPDGDDGRLPGTIFVAPRRRATRPEGPTAGAAAMTPVGATEPQPRGVSSVNATEPQPRVTASRSATEPQQRTPTPAIPTSRSSRAPYDPELPEIGSMLDKYRIEEVIGAGGFAMVFRARHVLLDMPVAIKLLRPRIIRRSPNLATSLCEEARFAARINHPNVVRVFDVTHTPEITYIVMEYVEGDTLAELIHRRGAMRGSKVLRVGLAVASGLRAGLAERVIHRDIKPTNIVITRAGHTKIVDLGLARRLSDGEPRDDDESSRAIVGTPGYMAPEQALHPNEVDFRADIYSLGVTLYHAAVGAPPFPINDAMRCMALHQSSPVPRPSERVTISAQLEDLLMWMLAKSPSKRPDSYELLLSVMKRALEATEAAS